MLKFSEYEYRPLEIEKITKDLTLLIEKFKNAKSAKQQSEILKEINDYRSDVETNMSLANVRFTINTQDPYYKKQKEMIDEVAPSYTALVNQFYKALVESPFRKSLEKKEGKLIFKMAEVALKAFDDSIIEDLVQENKLTTKYDALIASAKIRFQGKIYNLSELSKFLQSDVKATRAAASKAQSKWFEKHLEELDQIFDQLVHVRHQMATKLGYKNFVELGYLRLGRLDYDAKDVAAYRDQIYKYVVPLSKKLFRRQAKRLHLRAMKYYDYNLQFLSGNATPHGTTNELLQSAKQMYKEMSFETDQFFTFMCDSELLDLQAKANKASGGYCTSFPTYKAPFIFANFNGTSGDVDVLTHEVGHAFMCYCCKDVPLLEYVWPTYEACEIHSMSMEFFAYPWMELFFKEDTDKYKFSHLSNAVTFLPYGVAVDEFQHYVYENVDITPEQRRAKWREIEKKYLPHLKYGKNTFLENGGKWMRQSHIFDSPFYYIDYTLAQVCAFQFFNLMNQDYHKAWETYVQLCKLGGSQSFLQLLKTVHLENPFKKGCVRHAIKPIAAYLDTFNDLNM